MEIFDYLEAARTRFPHLWADAQTVPELIALLESQSGFPHRGDVIARMLSFYLERNTEYLPRFFQTFKAHGFMIKALMLPEAKTFRDIVSTAGLFPYRTPSTIYEHDRDIRCDGVFMHSDGPLNEQGIYFGPLGARYAWKPCGKDRVRSQAGGQNYLTRGKPTPALVTAWETSIGPVNDREWGLSSLRAISWQDGRQLIVGGSRNSISQRWVAVLPAGESVWDMYSDHERGEIAAEYAAKREAFQ